MITNPRIDFCVLYGCKKEILALPHDSHVHRIDAEEMIDRINVLAVPKACQEFLYVIIYGGAH